MGSNITINPSLTSNALGSFNIDTTGYIQGTALDSPNARYNLAGGVLKTSEAYPMWGGVAVFEQVATLAAYNSPSLGNVVGRATTVTATSATGLAGFSVFDQDYAAINSPQSPVPLVGGGNSVHFYRLGSGARIAVACDPSLSSLEGGAIAQALYWDPTAQMLLPTADSNDSVTSLTWSSTNGGQVAVVMASSSSYALGDTISFSGVTNTGTGGTAAINTAQVINTFTDSQHFTFLLPGTSTLWGTLGGTIVTTTLLTMTGLIKVLDVNVGNSMTVVYNQLSGFATWNRSGSTAIILI